VTDTNNDEPFDPDDRPKPTQPSVKAAEMFQRALEIQAAKASVEWEPKGKRIEYITIEIALMRGTYRKRLGCKRAGCRRACKRSPRVAEEPMGNRVMAARHSPAACSAGYGPETDPRLARQAPRLCSVILAFDPVRRHRVVAGSLRYESGSSPVSETATIVFRPHCQRDFRYDDGDRSTCRPRRTESSGRTPLRRRHGVSSRV
jgi:hypothetical protein